MVDVSSVTIALLVVLANQLVNHATRCWVSKVWRNWSVRSRASCWWVCSQAPSQTCLMTFRRHRMLTLTSMIPVKPAHSNILSVSF